LGESKKSIAAGRHAELKIMLEVKNDKKTLLTLPQRKGLY